MNIISHRGYWKSSSEKNTSIAFERSFDLGFGTETDVRDYAGRLVVSHDIPGGNEISWEDFLAIHARHRDLPLAVNIKADGLAMPLKKLMSDSGVKDWFVFDMSIPDMRSYFQAGVQVFARMSEVEISPAWLSAASGVWLDAFDSQWYSLSTIAELLNDGKRVCVVSPELHGRQHDDCWNMLKPLADHPSLMLCTDYPQVAKQFFEGA